MRTGIYSGMMVALLLAGCSAAGQHVTQASTGPGLPALQQSLDADATGLPDLDELAGLLDVRREESTLDESRISFSGKQYRADLPSARASNGIMNSVVFHPDYLPGPGSPSTGIAFVMYAFQALDYDRLSEVRLDWDGTAQAQDWLLGLANWQSGRWDFLPGTEGGTEVLDSLDPYFAADGSLLAAVVVLGTGSPGLYGIRLGQPGPLATFTTTPLTGKSPLTVSFMGGQSSSPNGSIVNYRFDPDGSGLLDNGSNPDFMHTYSTPGWYKAHCEVEDESGLSSEQVFNVFASAAVNTNPVADFTASPDLGEAPLLVDFDAALSLDPDGSIIAYLWDFQNDGTFDFVGDQPQAQHLYQHHGNFSVKLLVVDDKFGTASISRTNSVVSNDDYEPVAQIEWLMDSAYAPASVQLSAEESFDTDGFIASYAWDLDNDFIYELSGPDKLTAPVQFPQPGSYPVHLKLTDNEGLVGNMTVDVLVMEGWQRTIGSLLDDEFAAAVPDQQGGVLACGTIRTGTESEDIDELVARFDENGVLLWARSLDLTTREEAHGIALNEQGVIMVVGRGYNPTFKKYFGVVNRWDLAGNSLSSKFYGTLDASEEASAVVAAGDDFIVSGFAEVKATGLTNLTTMRLDGAGSILWARQLEAQQSMQPAGLAVQYDPNDAAAALVYSLASLSPQGNGSALFQQDISGNLLWQKDLTSTLGPCTGSALLAGEAGVLLAGSVREGMVYTSFSLSMLASGTELGHAAYLLPNRFVPSGVCLDASGDLFLAVNGLMNFPGGIGLVRLAPDLSLTDYYVGKWPGKVTTHSFLSCAGNRLITGGMDEHTGSYWLPRDSAPAELELALSDAGYGISDLSVPYLNIAAQVSDPSIVQDAGGGGTDACLHMLALP